MPYNNPGGIVAASVILEIIAVGCVCLRLMAVKRVGMSFSVSDYLIVSALVCATGLTVMEIYGVAVKSLAYPLDATLADPRAVDGRLNIAKHIELSFLLLGIFTLGLIKVSVCFLYWRIFAAKVNNTMFRRVLIVWVVILLAWTLSFVIAGLAECGHHLKALFSTPQSYLKNCGSAIPTGWAMVGSDIATDVITLIFPIPMIMSLQMARNRRILVLLMFAIGALSVGASVAKATIYIRSSLGYDKTDAILTLTALSIWNLVEVQVGIIAACGPMLRQILNTFANTCSESLHSLARTFRGSFSSGRSSNASDRSRKRSQSSQASSNGHWRSGLIPTAEGPYVKAESQEHINKQVYAGDNAGVGYVTDVGVGKDEEDVVDSFVEMRPVRKPSGIRVKHGVRVESR